MEGGKGYTMEGGRGYTMEGGKGYTMEGGRGYTMEGGKGYTMHARHFGTNSFQELHGFYGDHFEEVCAVRSYKWLTPHLFVCSYLVCFVEGLLQESADLVGSGALLHLLLVLTKEQLSIHVLWGGRRRRGRGRG